MAKTEPSVDQWLREAKADPAAAQCGMFLTHNGVVRITPKAQVREGVEGLGEVVAVEFSYDAEGLAAAEAEALTWPGVYYVRTWLNEGRCEVGDSLRICRAPGASTGHSGTATILCVPRSKKPQRTAPSLGLLSRLLFHLP